MNQERERSDSGAFEPNFVSDLSVNSNSSVSPSSSSCSSSATSSSRNHQMPTTSADCLVSDEELARISVKQLNQRLQGQDRDIVSQFKQKRRTLKNRGYALNCRVRRIETQLNLESENMQLKTENISLRQALAELQHRLQYYESTVSYDFYVPIPPNSTPGNMWASPNTV